MSYCSNSFTQWICSSRGALNYLLSLETSKEDQLYYFLKRYYGSRRRCRFPWHPVSRFPREFPSTVSKVSPNVELVLSKTLKRLMKGDSLQLTKKTSCSSAQAFLFWPNFSSSFDFRFSSSFTPLSQHFFPISFAAFVSLSSFSPTPLNKIVFVSKCAVCGMSCSHCVENSNKKASK